MRWFGFRSRKKRSKSNVVIQALTDWMVERSSTKGNK